MSTYLWVGDGTTQKEAYSDYTQGAPESIPNDDGRRGAVAVAALARELGASDTLVCLLSGGASALAMLPDAAIPLADVQRATELLLRAGASIDELNCVRKHLDQLKGGRLARLAAPARVIGLVLSDVVGDRLDVVPQTVAINL